MGCPGKMSVETKERRKAGCFQDAFLRAQGRSVPLNKSMGRGGRRPAWLGQNLLVTLREKKGLLNQRWKTRMCHLGENSSLPLTRKGG